MEENIIPDAINYLASQRPGTREYKDALEAYNTLIKIEAMKKELEPPSRLTRIEGNAPVVNGIVTLIVSVVMLQFEKTDIITSSVRSFIRRS
jgi:hypothetical protein